MARYKFTFVRGTQSFLLCETARHLAESGITLNGQRVLRHYQLLGAENASVQDGKNQRNTLSFDAARQVDFKGELFKDEGEAFVFALDLLGALKGVGRLKMEIDGDGSSAVRWLANTAVEAAALTRLEGVSMVHRYTLNGGAMTTTDPRSMSVTLNGYKVRCEVETARFDTPFRTVGGSTPAVPLGADLRFEFLFRFNGELVDVEENFDHCDLEIYAANRTGSALLEKTISSFSNVTEEDWAAGTDQHCVLDLTAAEIEASPLTATISGKEYFLLLVVREAAGDAAKILAEAWTRFVVITDNYA